eukprot:202029_1
MDYMADQQNIYQLIWMINKQIIKPEIISFKTIPNGIMFDMSVSAAPSDLEIYLLWSVSEYILATKDINFLSENIYLNVYDETENDYVNYSVLDCLMESYQYLRSHIGIGKHGVIRLLWLNTAMVAYVLPLLSGVLNKTETNILINSINKRLREYTNAIGATNVVPPYNNPTGTINGTHENGGIWPSQNQPLVIALSTVNSTLAFDEWQKNSLHIEQINIYEIF